jgi:hydrogenase expression/formation protein HypD
VKYVDEYRQPEAAQAIAAAIARLAAPQRRYRIMEFCGGHTHAIFRYGLRQLLPANVEFIHGPGCPVCVLPGGRLESLLRLLEQRDIILCSYGDMLRVPAAQGRSLQRLKAQGAEVRMVYSTQDALQVARENPQREVVFFAIGFETTTPATAVALITARDEKLENFSVYCNHVLTPPAMAAILSDAGDAGGSAAIAIDALLGPSHVSAIIGSEAYAPLAQRYKKPIVIAGFEPLDLLQSTLMAIVQINAGRHEIENEYRRAVSAGGNEKAQALMAGVFTLRDEFEWRGLGVLPRSALAINAAYAAFDAEQRFAMEPVPLADNKGCDCAEVLRGRRRPEECKLFARACTPDNPMGACMVSAEGACAAVWHYGEHQAQGAG